MNLLYFILGVFFIQTALPLLDGVSAWFLTWVEMKKSKLSEVINQSNIKMRDDANREAPQRLIGFQAEDYEEEEDDYEI